VAQRKSFLLRVDPLILAALRRWANDEMRSLNGHLEFILRKALRDAGRLNRGGDAGPQDTPPRPATGEE
jgi:hypothetical protein